MQSLPLTIFLGAALTLSACGGTDTSSAGGTGGTGGTTATGGAGGGEPVSLVVGLSTGFQSTCARIDDGRIKCWGNNGHGQLGLGDTASRGDQAGEMGAHLPSLELPAGVKPFALAGTNETVCIQMSGGDDVRCWGHNGNGQLGLGDTDARGDGPMEVGESLKIVDLGVGLPPLGMATGYTHACAIQGVGKGMGGAVKCWGDNGACQLGQGTIGGNVGDAAGEMGDALVTVDLGAGALAAQIVAGRSHTCALLVDGAVKCWGSNTSGQLGLGDATSRGCSAATVGDNLPAVDVGGPVQALSAGGNHTCALLKTGEVKCWGANESGQLGQGTTGKVGDGPGEMGAALAPVALGGKATQISAGDAHTCALLDDGAVKCWGANKYGQLGQGSTDNLGDGPGELGDALQPVNLGFSFATEVRAGHTHTCVVLVEGTVKCWGSGASGALGAGDVASLGDGPGEMGDALPTVKLFNADH